MKINHRRDFLKKSVLGLAGAALIPGSLKANSSGHADQQQIPDHPSRILGRTGIKTPLISMGAGQANNAGFVKAAYYAGIKLFFSATYYGEGNNERLVGEGLRGLPRDSFIVGTAVPPDNFDSRTGLFNKDFSYEGYMKKATDSLARFGLDYVDIVMFPYAGKRDSVLNESLLKVLTDLKKQGKTKYLGIASHGDTVEALNAAVDSKVYDVAMIAYNFKSGNMEALDAAIAKASGAGMGIVAMKTTAGVFNDKSGKNQINSDSALKWVLRNENIASIVSGMSSIEELQKNLAMIRNLKMTEQDGKDLKLAYDELEKGLYCRQCRQCVPQCIHNYEIPTVMRSYMYAYGYRNPAFAQQTLVTAGLPSDACSDCSSCSVNCASGFDVRERIADISRLKGVPGEFLIS
ncbi:MAG: aldo/keto reductase [Bacteroidales bacterium]